MSKIFSVERLRKINVNAAAVMTSIYCAMVTAMPVLASEDEITQGIIGGTEKIWNIIVGIVGPLAAIALAVCAVKILWGGQRAAEEAKGTAIKIIIGIALVLLAPTIVNAIRGWFTQGTWSFS